MILFVVVCVEYFVGSIDDLVEIVGISKNFIGLILILIVGNVVEYVIVVVVVIRNKMDLVMGVVIGFSIQIVLGVIFFFVIVGWVIGRDMFLYFEICK